MYIEKTTRGYSFRFDRGRKSLYFAYFWNRWLHPKDWFIWKDNGAVKGKDSCYDFNMEILGLHIGYTNWLYDRKEYRK